MTSPDIYARSATSPLYTGVRLGPARSPCAQRLRVYQSHRRIVPRALKQHEVMADAFAVREVSTQVENLNRLATTIGTPGGPELHDGLQRDESGPSRSGRCG